MAERVGFEPTVPVRYDGFQDRSVMTTSVSLRKLLQYVIIMNGLCQVIFLIFYGRRGIKICFKYEKHTVKSLPSRCAAAHIFSSIRFASCFSSSAVQICTPDSMMLSLTAGGSLSNSALIAGSAQKKSAIFVTSRIYFSAFVLIYARPYDKINLQK